MKTANVNLGVNAMNTQRNTKSLNMCQQLLAVAAIAASTVSVAQTPNSVTTCSNGSIPGQVVCNTQMVYQLGSGVTYGNGFAIVPPNTGPNVAPVANADAASVAANGNVLINVLGNDTDANGDALTVQSVTTPNLGTAIIESNKVRYTAPSSVAAGTATFQYTIADTSNATSTATVTITIGGTTNSNPIANTDNVTVASGAQLNISVLANDTDPNGDTLTLSSVSSAGQGTVVKSGNLVVYTAPTVTSATATTFTYTVTDGNGGSAVGTVNVDITASTAASSCPSGALKYVLSSTVASYIDSSGQYGTTPVSVTMDIDANTTTTGTAFLPQIWWYETPGYPQSRKHVTLSKSPCNFTTPEFVLASEAAYKQGGWVNVLINDTRPGLTARMSTGRWYINVRNIEGTCDGLCNTRVYFAQ